MADYDPMLLERASLVKMLALDVDGILTDGRLYFDSQGNEMKAFHTRDGLGLKALQKFGIELALITGRSSPMVAARAEQLGIRHVYQGRDDKLEAYLDLIGKTGLEHEHVCYAGDDWIDLPVLIRVGLAITVPDAEEHVRRRVHWVTRRGGGHGAVREICDLILTAQGHDQVLLDGYLSS